MPLINETSYPQKRAIARPLNPSMEVSMPFLQSPLDVILATTKQTERPAQKCVYFFKPPKLDRRLSKAIFLPCVCLAYVCSSIS